MASNSREIILTSSPSGPIAAYDHLTGAMLARFSGSRSPRGGLALIGDTLIAASHVSAAACGFVQLYNWWSPTSLHCIPTPEPVAPLVATPDGSYLFSGGVSGRIHGFSLPSGNLHRSLRAHRQPVSCLAISDDGSLLLSGGDDGRIAVFPIIRLLDASASTSDDRAELALYQFSAHDLSVTRIAPGPGGCNATIVSSSIDCMCKFWSLADGTHLRTVRFPCPMWCVVIDPTNSEAYAGGSDGRVYVVPMQARRRRPRAGEAEVVALAAEQSGAVMAVAMASGGRSLVSASEDGIIKVWEVESGSVVRNLGFESSGISDLAVAKGTAWVGGASFSDESIGPDGGNPGFSVRGLCKEVREVGEMEEWLGVMEKDRRRAVDTLEAAIGTYERLLSLILKEAKGGEGEEEAKDLE